MPKPFLKEHRQQAGRLSRRKTHWRKDKCIHTNPFSGAKQRSGIQLQKPMGFCAVWAEHEIDEGAAPAEWP